jgi:signal peptidase II
MKQKLYILFLVALIVMIDQTTKSVAQAKLSSSPPVSLLNGMVQFLYTENPGAILGLGSALPAQIRFLIQVVFVGLIVTVMIVYLFRAQPTDLLQLTGIALIIAGGVGNLIDRFLHDGKVIDFVRLGVGSLYTGIFNIADVAIMAGILLVLVTSMRGISREAHPSHE